MNRDQDPRALPSHIPNGFATPTPGNYGPLPAGHSLWFQPPPQQATSNPQENTGTGAEGGPKPVPGYPAQQFPVYPFSQPQYAPQPPRYMAGTGPNAGDNQGRPMAPFYNHHPQMPGPSLSPRMPVPVVPATTETGPDSQHLDKLRVRVNKACERCRTHKIKCTGTSPCLNCQKLGKHCRFRSLATIEDHAPKLIPVDVPVEVTPNSNESPERHAAEPGSISESLAKIKREPVSSNENTSCGNFPDHTYVTYLENRVRYLESIVAQTSLNGPGSLKFASSLPLEDMVDIQRPTSGRWRVCRRYQGALAIRLCSSLYQGLSAEAQAQVQIPRTNYYGFNMSGCHYLRPEDLPRLPDVSSFSPDEKAEILDYFFEEINSLYAIVHEKVFREQYSAYRVLFDGPEPSTNMVLFSAMLALVTALSIRFMEFMKPEGPSKSKLLLEESLFRYAHKVIQIFSTEWESFELIQCWLLAALYFRIAHRQTSCFLGLGRALSMCQSMGLGRYEKVPYTSTPYEIAKAKQIFYAAFTFDRILGLQGGRNKAILDTEIHRPFPLLDYEKEHGDDGWMTLPAFAMLHIARLTKYLETDYSNEYEMTTADKMHRDFDELRLWLNENGFDDETDIFQLDANEPQISSMVKAQVKFHFYDLIQSIQGKTLFSYFGHRASIEGMKLAIILQTNHHMMALLQKVRASGKLYAPWYLTLQTILTVGVNSLVFINGGIHVAESKRLMKETMSILQILRHSPVYDKRGKVIFKQRFKMADECNWLFKMISHIMLLHCQESLKDLHDFGTDHGSSEVNKRSLEFESPANPYLYEHKRPKTGIDSVTTNDWPTDTIPTSVLETSQQTPSSDMPDCSVDQFLDNLAWFDQWLDFNHET